MESKIFYEAPDDCMVTVAEESVQLIKETAKGRNLTTYRLAIRTGIDKGIIEGLYYGRHRIRLTYLQTICDTVFGDNLPYILQEQKIPEKESEDVTG